MMRRITTKNYAAKLHPPQSEIKGKSVKSGEIPANQ